MHHFLILSPQLELMLLRLEFNVDIKKVKPLLDVFG